jgi:hypothetical protein
MAPSRVGSVPRKAEIIITSSLNNRTAVSTWMMGLDQNTHPFEAERPSGTLDGRCARVPCVKPERMSDREGRSHRAHRGAADSSVGGVRAPGSGFSGAAFRPPMPISKIWCVHDAVGARRPGARQGRPAHHPDHVKIGGPANV